jgi:hypothetical protein
VGTGVGVGTGAGTGMGVGTGAPHQNHMVPERVRARACAPPIMFFNVFVRMPACMRRGKGRGRGHGRGGDCAGKGAGAGMRMGAGASAGVGAGSPHQNLKYVLKTVSCTYLHATHGLYAPLPPRAPKPASEPAGHQVPLGPEDPPIRVVKHTHYGISPPIRVVEHTLSGPEYPICVVFPTLSRPYHPNMAKEVPQIATTWPLYRP